MTTDMDKLIADIEALPTETGWISKADAIALIRKHQAEQQGVDECRKALAYIQPLANAAYESRDVAILEYNMQLIEARCHTALAITTAKMRPAEPVDLEVCKKAVASVFVPDGIYNIEEGWKMERAAKAVLTAANVKWKE